MNTIYSLWGLRASFARALAASHRAIDNMLSVEPPACLITLLDQRALPFLPESSRRLETPATGTSAVHSVADDTGR